MWGEIGSLALAAIAGRVAWTVALQRKAQYCQDALMRERSASHHLCFSTLESLVFAVEASTPYNLGHLQCVQHVTEGLARALELPEVERDALRAAALLHNIGRLGVPENIWHKADTLTPEEQEKLRTHPVLGARILAPIPFPWEVVPLVRHHAEHWDGNGYPDGLRETEIPLGARILSVANAYSALLHPRPYRPAFLQQEALAEIERGAGSQFDPGVVFAFRKVAASLRAEAERDQIVESRTEMLGEAQAEQDVREALNDIAAAQRETQGLYRLAQLVGQSLHLEVVGETLLTCAREVVPSATAVLFLPDEDDEFLRAYVAQGVNARHFLGSQAQVGAYITGRVFCRGELKTASFLPDDVALRNVSGTWTDLRSTLVVPLMSGSQCLGTLNLYSEQPDAFGGEAQRIMRLVATQAGRALDNATRYARAQEGSLTDALTGLRNGRYLGEFLEREFNRAQREEMPLAVLNIDLNNFKPINDRFGHARGDQVLREIAAILHGQIRNYDLAARYAGDEFVIVLPKSGPIQAQTITAKLKQEVARYSARLHAREPEFPGLGISVGIAVFPDNALDVQELLCRSDAAMYEDKKNRVAARPLV